MTGGIDYDALAAALLRAGMGANVGVNADDTKLNQDGPSGSVDKGGLDAVKSGPGEHTSPSDGVESWADAVEDAPPVANECEGTTTGSESGSVEILGGGTSVGDDVRARVTFGGMSDGLTGVVSTTTAPGFYNSVVRSSRAKALRAYVERLMGCKLPKHAHADLALCTFTAGCMPDTVVNGKVKLRTLAAVGDAAVTLHLVVESWASGCTVESAQRERSKRTSNRAMNEIMVRTGMISNVSYPSGVDPSTTAATATAFEAIVGVLALFMTHEAVREFLVGVKLLDERSV